ncbi:excalibur calcium-binding domain-containing protein [Corynebacterium renale]|uniref:excalibur calcium-binding domain-containing protein n=1 Tax=Corynebacterium renale TaxID=1724 RepID=UPI00065366DF|nr:excalibur calcium-binding domain-containing protein [Corynebacterium renale]
MFKKLFVASVATTLIATASPALAQDTIPVAESPNPITTLEGPLKKDQPRGALSDGEIAGIVLGVIGAVTLIGGGAVWAIQQGFIPNPLPGILPSPAPAPAPLPAAAPRPATKMYPNCRAVWRDLGRPIRRSDAGYDTHLDRDGDGIGCERRPR